MVILDTYFISKYMVNKTNTPEKIVWKTSRYESRPQYSPIWAQCYSL
jgi:hypothetical protein